MAKQLNITRSSVNAWEQGISVPSTQYVIELANIFSVSTDYMLGVSRTAAISIDGLGEEDIKVVSAIVCLLREKNNGQQLLR